MLQPSQDWHEDQSRRLMHADAVLVLDGSDDRCVEQRARLLEDSGLMAMMDRTLPKGSEVYFHRTGI